MDPDVSEYYYLSSQDSIVELCSLGDNISEVLGQEDLFGKCLLDYFLDKDSELRKYYGAEDSKWATGLGTNLRYHFNQAALFSTKKIKFQADCLPIVILGNTYITNSTLQNSAGKNYAVGDQDFVRSQVIARVKKLIWVTYRRNFRPLQKPNGDLLTSDAGWGCTIRVGQMLFLHCLQKHFNIENQNPYYLIELIQENLLGAPFSLHSITNIGREFEKSPGDWYAPSTMCLAIQKFTEMYSVPNLKSVVFMDCVMYKDQILHMACEDRVWKYGILVLVPLMLGLRQIQPEYYEALKFFLEAKESVGVIGGKPKSALYLIGYQDNNLIYLDPHLVQKACKNEQDLLNNLHTYMAESPRTISFQQAESSIALGFYFGSLESFKNFEQEVEERKPLIRGVISIQEHTPPYYYEEPDLEVVTSEEEDYVML